MSLTNVLRLIALGHLYERERGMTDYRYYIEVRYQMEKKFAGSDTPELVDRWERYTGTVFGSAENALDYAGRHYPGLIGYFRIVSVPQPA